MEIIRSSLKILFKEAEIPPLLRGEEQIFAEEPFVRMFQKENPYMSLDQCLLSAANVRQYYMRPLVDAAGLAFAEQGAAIMNVPLHFTKDILIEENSFPVCRFEHLLRWHTLSSSISEDLLTTSYLASKDVALRKERKCFAWNIVLGQDDPRLKHLFRKHIADIHMHLKGSSGNFDLNWLALMNHILDRSEAFKALSHIQAPNNRLSTEIRLNDYNPSNPLYAMAIKACAIRLFLYKHYVCELLNETNDDICSFTETLLAEDDDYAIFNSYRLDDFVRIERFKAAIAFPEELSKVYDYIYNPTIEEIGKNPNIILQGERYFLYRCFKACYSNQISAKHCLYFYVYLLIKNKIRNELIQTNEIVGFRNFDTYEKRKTIFIDNYQIYKDIISPLALGFYWNESSCTGRRYVEPRIAPADSAKDLYDTIRQTDIRVGQLYGTYRKSSYHYVLHFIKRKDDPIADSELIQSRHYNLRNRIHLQAENIQRLRHSRYCYYRIVGIDAANSEIETRPEVFAQAFRFLQNDQIERIYRVIQYDLGMTYHVGEDFINITDGLRAIDEVLHFMNFKRGSRIGHALVLGVNVNEYMRARHNSFLLSKQMLLDDIAWMLNECENVSYRGIRELEYNFYTVFRTVYNDDNITVRDYYDSWLLRGDNPSCYQDYQTITSENWIEEEGVSGWARHNYNQDKAARKARKNRKARELYHHYHFNRDVRIRGNEITDFQYPEGSAELIDSLQQKMMAKLVSAGIGIETNPTSNIRIGGFKRYSEHPIHKFFPINDNENKAHLLTSVNTDDRGVFATSIEREYALLACAQFKERQPFSCIGPTHDTVLEWLDKLRNNGLIQRFRNDLNV